MSKYLIEVDGELNRILEDQARHKNMSIESLVAEILNRYLVPLHTMEQEEELAKGYEETGDINLDWANL